MKKYITGKTIGGILMIAAVGSVFLVDWKPEMEEEPPVIRPLKTFVIGKIYTGTRWKYPGKVSASERATMAFEVGGTVKELLVKEGDGVSKGQVLARLDPRDYENAAEAAKAEVQRARSHLDRIKIAAKSNAVSKQEVSNAQAAFDKAAAELKIKAKAVEDTEIRASFDGTIAKTYVETFENVQSREEILSLQDITHIEIKASIPEARIAQVNPDEYEANREKKERNKFTASFDYFPDRTFDLEIKEFATEADPATQTYTATFIMEASKDVTILPGMTAMVSEHLREEKAEEGQDFTAPLDAVPVDGLGQYFVWRLEPDEGDTYRVARRDIEVGEMSGSVSASSPQQTQQSSHEYRRGFHSL